MEEDIKFYNERKLYSIIGSNIKYYRRLYSVTKKEITQNDLAKLINTSTSLIGNLESKNTYQGISVYNLYKISKILEVSIDDFFIQH